MTTTADLAIDVQDLRMRYGPTDVLRDVSLHVRHGEIVALLGPNGAGKTTTIEILEGFRMRSAGRTDVLGVDPAQGSEAWRAQVGVVLQSWRDHPKWRVRELLAYQGTYYAPYGTETIPRPWNVDDLLAVGLTEQANTQVRMLSGGQRRRLDVAIGLVGCPELLFLDEPTAGLDPEARREFHELIHGIAGSVTILLTTHDLDEAERLADRIVILSRGVIIADGTPAELSQRIAGEDEVRWVRDGRRLSASTRDSTSFVRDLFARFGEGIGALEVRRASLEDTYLTLVKRAESGAETDSPGLDDSPAPVNSPAPDDSSAPEREGATS